MAGYNPLKIRNEKIGHCFFYGGNWNYGSQNGLFNLNLNNAASNSNNNIGGRIAKDHIARSRGLKGPVTARIPLGGDVLAFVSNAKEKHITAKRPQVGNP